MARPTTCTWTPSTGAWRSAAPGTPPASSEPASTPRPKLLLLEHAFEALGCLAVEFRTHHANTRSQAAIERLGAHRDGVLRKHLIMPDGHVRDTVVYSILDTEWPDVKARLRTRLERG